MTVRVLCDNAECRAVFEVTEECLGQSGSCPRCGVSFVLSDSALNETRAYQSKNNPPIDIPVRLGRYDVIRKLGEGGMGAVYLARDTQLDRDVALKVPLASQRNTLEVLERFNREAKTGASFQHPNFCPIHEVGQHDGWNYLVMAFIDGQTLASMIAKDGPMPLRRAAAITRKLALALQEAHDRGITHRDLKPSNVMVSRRRELIIMDFGLARREGSDDPELTQSGVVLGSPHYMAPEQVRAEREQIGPATDIYALGVMLYEMLTGRRPFLGVMSLVLGLIATSKPEPPSKHRVDLDPELEGICLKAMAQNPIDRFKAMRALGDALEAYLANTDRPVWKPPALVRQAAQGLPGPLPEVDDIQLVPDLDVREPKHETSAFVDDPEETGSAYHLDVTAIPPAPPPKPPADNPWTAPPMEETAWPSRELTAKPASRPKNTTKQSAYIRSRAVTDLALIILCLAILGAGIGGFGYFMNRDHGTILIVLPPFTADVRIDSKIVSPDDLKAPIELPTGEHELLLSRDNRILANERFKIVPGTNPPLNVNVAEVPPGVR